MTEPDPNLRPEERPGDADRALRPQSLDEFVGQQDAKANLRVFIESARQRGQAMDHTLFHGPPGLGKTTLAQIIARELGVNFRMTSGPVLARAGDLAAILTNLDERDVLFIDEIHRRVRLLPRNAWLGREVAVEERNLVQSRCCRRSVRALNRMPPSP